MNGPAGTDLVEAEEALERIIRRAGRGYATDSLQNSLRQIQAEFDKAFKELFGGGKGSLDA